MTNEALVIDCDGPSSNRRISGRPTWSPLIATGRCASAWALMPHVGEDKFFWASDYPHPDHPGAYLEELRGMVGPMTESGRRGILGENVARTYRLS
jgi:predicted TIM-barrel fold metal-dependent hydrolase